MQKKTVSKKILQDIVHRIVEVAHPERIIMFGSAARGEMGPHSDIDLLVIKKNVRNPRDVAAKIYIQLYGVGKAVDIIVVSPEQVEKYRDSPYLVIYPATRDGVVIYDAERSLIAKRAREAEENYSRGQVRSGSVRDLLSGARLSAPSGRTMPGSRRC